MKSYSLITYFFIIFLTSGCTYDPYENKSYVCDETHKIAPHNFQNFVGRDKNYNLGNIVIKPFIYQKGGYSDGENPPFYLWVQVFSTNSQNKAVEISSIDFKSSINSVHTIGDNFPVELNLEKVSESFYRAEKYFEKTLYLDFDNNESVTVTIKMKQMNETKPTSKEMSFLFRAKLNKGLFKIISV